MKPFVHRQENYDYLQADEKPTNLLWMNLNSKDTGPMTERQAIAFRDLVRACLGKEPVRAETKPDKPSVKETKQEGQQCLLFN